MDNLSIPTIWSAFPERMEELRYEMGSVDRELTAVYGLCHTPRQCTSVNARTLLRRLVQRASARSTTIRTKIRQLKVDNCVSAADQDFNVRRLQAVHERHLGQVRWLYQSLQAFV